MIKADNIKLKMAIAVAMLAINGITLAQGFLHADGKRIVDGNGNNFIIRSIGTGNWMIQEGYMMQTAGVAATQHEFRAKLEQQVGIAKTDSFYNTWLKNHFTKRDVDSMKAWGFNAVRPALHYVWFTPPIENEPTPDTITWINKGFEMLDSLVEWCAENKMYVILDMHGTPGGQGTNADISDYNPNKPSLWESQKNKDKLIALWVKLAERYSTNPWVGGYDLINETNWQFSEPDNKPLWNLFKELTTAIRKVDTNHMIILEGNWFANDYTGLPQIWDNNLVLSFHKYWTYNDDSSLDWMITLRDKHNVPLWLGESGENSNVWFTNLIALCERKNIGWSWWPVKKTGINNVLQVNTNAGYAQLIKSWKGELPAMSANDAFNAVMGYAENHKIENCVVQRDVIDAMLRQPFTTQTIAFDNHKLGERIFFAHYDLGRNGYAYFDSDTANYHGNTNQYTNWNQGWAYRNDGVDLQKSTDNLTSSNYTVGWTNAGEWLQYTINVPDEMACDVEIRCASAENSGLVHFEIDGQSVSKHITMPNTGGWDKWATSPVGQIILPKGNVKLRLFIDRASANLNFFVLKNPVPVALVNFKMLTAQTVNSNNKIRVTLNKPVTKFDVNGVKNGFELKADGNIIKIANVEQVGDKVLEILCFNSFLYNQNITLSYSGQWVSCHEQNLDAEQNLDVLNNLPVHAIIPGKIEAENYQLNSGFETENCTDYGEGKNLSYADAGDYADYIVYVEKSGVYKIDYRVASKNDNSSLILYLGSDNNIVPRDTVFFDNTGDWQTWKTQSSQLKINSGLQTLRIKVKQGQFNLNWIKFGLVSSAKSNETIQGFNIFPNPANDNIFIESSPAISETKQIIIYNTQGQVVYNQNFLTPLHRLDTQNFMPGIYMVTMYVQGEYNTQKLIKQ